MRKLQLLVTAFIRSISDPSYFKEVYRASWRFSLIYFTAVVVLMSLLMASVSGRWLATLDITRIPREVLAEYPTDLEIRLTNQGIALNKTLPYSIELPKSWSTASQANYRNLATFVNATASVKTNDIASYSALMVITPGEIYIPQLHDNGTTEVVRMYAIPGFNETIVLNKPYLDQHFLAWFETGFIAHKWYAWLIGAVLFVVLVPFLWIFQMVVYAVISLLFWIMTRFISGWRHLSFGQIYRISLVLLTFSLVADVALDFLDLNRLKFPWLWFASLAWLSLGAYIAFSVPKTTETVEAKIPTSRRTGTASLRAKKR